MHIRIVTALLLTQLCCSHVAKADARSVKGLYRNPAEGYAIRIPKDLEAIAGDQAGPERGVGIRLPSGGEIVSIGEPNSAEYKNPDEGVRHYFAFLEHCRTTQLTVNQAKMGKLIGAEGRFVCESRVYVVRLAFRPGGEPIYWLQLKTDLTHEHADLAVFQSIASSLRIIRWQ